MIEVSTNPLVNMTLEELNIFLIAIDRNFSVKEVKGEVVEDYKTRWSKLYDDCLKYAYWNHEIITKDYPFMGEKKQGHIRPFESDRVERTFGDIVKIMINKQKEKIW